MKENTGNNMYVNGFAFSTAEEAQEAERENQKIQYLEARIDYSDLRKVQAIYEKAVKDNIFQTEVGLFYLKGIRDFLVREDGRLDEVLSPVPLPKRNTAKTKTAEKKRQEKQEQAMQSRNVQLRISVIINVVLVAAVLVMFYITLNSSQPNILNYEKALVNRYASWEQELTEREKTVREKELEFLRQ